MLYEIKIKCESIIPENITEGMLLTAFTYINTEKSINLRNETRESIKKQMFKLSLTENQINDIFAIEDLILELTIKNLEIYIHDNILKLNAEFDIDLDEINIIVVEEKIWRHGINLILMEYHEERYELKISGMVENILRKLFLFLYDLSHEVKIEVNKK